MTNTEERIKDFNLRKAAARGVYPQGKTWPYGSVLKRESGYKHRNATKIIHIDNL